MKLESAELKVSIDHHNTMTGKQNAAPCNEFHSNDTPS
jgi:hypothetical protein